MKVLVADDDALIRRLLMALLNKLGHEVQQVEDGPAAWKALDVPIPPSMAILDWVMPGMNGVDVCRKLRANPGKTRPYVLLLSAKADKQDVISGLDAGADDYLVKPFDPMSLLARLRVAQRIIAYQQELQQHISGMEILLHRHNLLGEMYGKQHRQADSMTAVGARDEPDKPATPGQPIKELVPPERMAQLIAASIAEVGLGKASVTIADKPLEMDGETFTAWAPLVLLNQGVWIDLLLEANQHSAVAMFEALLGRIPVSERELLDFLAETFNLICTSVRTAFMAGGLPALTPIISRTTRTEFLNLKPPTFSVTSHHHIRLPQVLARLTVISQPAPVQRKSLGQLRSFDILSENLPSPSAKEVFLLNQGVVLNERYIEKLASLAGPAAHSIRVPVVEPSRYAQFFCLGRVSG
jgi:CheY-like chemotaxis protein